MSKITSKDKLSLIDQSIGSLRKALLCKEKYYAKYIDYILGKDYYAKGKGYEEETLRYLEAARDAYGSGTAASGGNGGAQTSDTPADLDEYLGLAYAAVHDYRSSVASFSKALDKTASGDADRLYMAIAKSYSALKDDATACSYLILCVNSTKDANTKIQARLRLGAIYQGEGKNDLAEAQYNAIITENGNNAEAYYQLGKIYAANGDSVKARYEWRRALTADPTHAGARQALGLA
jgi:tetratricopeptide (TPR) repeat protein